MVKIFVQNLDLIGLLYQCTETNDTLIKCKEFIPLMAVYFLLIFGYCHILWHVNIDMHTTIYLLYFGYFNISNTLPHFVHLLIVLNATCICCMLLYKVYMLLIFITVGYSICHFSEEDKN